MESSFFVIEDALKRVQPGMQFDQAGRKAPGGST
jgi:hypothetical protein